MPGKVKADPRPARGKAIRQSVTIPAPLAGEVRRVAKERHLTMSRAVVALAERGVRAERDAKNGTVFVASLRTMEGRPDGAVVSMSTEAAATGRWVHVGGTVTLPEHRRLGLCGPCVAAVLERARAEGRASEGAVLFTGEGNAPALALYGRLGFEVECPFEMCFILGHGEKAAT